MAKQNRNKKALRWFFRASLCPLASFGWWFESFQNLSFFLKFPHLVFRSPILGRFFKRIFGQTQLTFLVNVGPGIALYVPWDPIEWFILYPTFVVSPKFIQDSNYIILYHLASHSTHCLPMTYFRSKMLWILQPRQLFMIGVGIGRRVATIYQFNELSMNVHP